MRASRGARIAFAALCLLIVAWTAVMSALEPVMLDGWFIDHWQHGHASFVDYVHGNWSGQFFWGNARLGQWITAFTYGEVFHLSFTPLCVLALFLLLLVHVRGRWPTAGWSDAWMLLGLLGVSVLAQPQLGPLLFYRPFTANYVVGLVVQLIWMVPFRFALEREVRRSLAGELAAAAGMIVLGVAAGACNEHTGPALILAGVIVVIRFARRRRLRAWMIAGVVGFVAGYLALMLAPAQATRYCGVAEISLAERIVDRGVLGNLKIVFALVWAGRWAWVGLAVAALASRLARPRPGLDARRAALAWFALAAAISVTLLASPKQGDRLLFASLALATIGIMVILDGLAGDRARVRAAIAGVAGAAVATAIVWSVAIQRRVANDYEDRLRVLAAAAPGTVVHLPMLRDGSSRWFLGDDLPSDSHRHHVANRYQLDAIDLEGHPTIPYRYEVRYQLAGAARVTTRQFLPLQHLCETRRDFADEVAALRAAHGARLAGAELAVAPRTRVPDLRELVASRWRDGRIVAPTASVKNEGYTRWISVERGGLTGTLDVILVGPGRIEHLEPDGGRWPYRPWGRGTYWIVTCAGDDCYLAETVRHTQV